MSKIILCKICKSEIVVNDVQQRAYAEKGWVLPKYCKRCKDERNMRFRVAVVNSIDSDAIGEDVDFARYIDSLTDDTFSAVEKVEYVKRGKNKMIQNKKRCDCCGRLVDAFGKYDMSRYAYKYIDKTFCGYKCYNKYITEIEKAEKEKEGIVCKRF